MADTFMGGYTEGVNTVLNILDFKGRQEDRQFRRKRSEEEFQLRVGDRTRRQRREDVSDKRTLRLDRVASEDRTYQRGRQEKSDRRTEQSHALGLTNELLSREIKGMNLSSMKTGKQREDVVNALVVTELFENLMDGNDKIDSNAFMESLNGVFSGLINQGSGKDEIKRIESIYLAEDQTGVVLELGIDDGKGSKSRKAPMTIKRSSDPDDPVVIIPWQDVFELYDGLREELKKAGMDTTTSEGREKAFDILHAALGNDKRRQERIAREDKKLTRMTPDERRVRELMKYYKIPGKESLSYKQATDMVMSGRLPRINPQREYRAWSEFYIDLFKALSGAEKRKIKEADGMEAWVSKKVTTKIKDINKGRSTADTDLQSLMDDALGTR